MESGPANELMANQRYVIKCAMAKSKYNGAYIATCGELCHAAISD